MNRDITPSLAIRRGTENDDVGWNGCLARNRMSSLLDELYPCIWLIARRNGGHIDALHKQRIKRRAVVVVESSNLCGIVKRLRSYGLLIWHESDFAIAHRAGLLPPHVSFFKFQRFSRPFRSLADTDVSHR